MVSRPNLDFLSLNYDVLSEILSFLPPKDARRLAFTSRNVYALAIRRALSEVDMSDPNSTVLFCKYMLLDVPGRSLFLEDLELRLEPSITDYDEELPRLLGDLLMQARNLKRLYLDDSERWLELEPCIGEAIAALLVITKLELLAGGARVLELLSHLCSRPLYLSYDCYLNGPAVHSPPLTSPALQKLEFLKISGLDTELGSGVVDSWQQYVALRGLQLIDARMPMASFVRTFPNIRTLLLKYMYRPNDWSSDTTVCWSCLDYVRGGVTDFQIWRVACPVHHLHLESMLNWTLRTGVTDEFREDERAGMLRAVEDMSPIVLTLEVDVRVGSELWRPLVNVVPRLTCLAVKLCGEGRPTGAALLAWTETVIPILASLKVTCLKVSVESTNYPRAHVPPEPGWNQDDTDPFDFFRAVCQTLPTLLAKSIVSLKYLSVAIRENDLFGPPDYLRRHDKTNAWWRVTRMGENRVMERFPTSEGEDLLERIRSEPGAEKKLIV